MVRNSIQAAHAQRKLIGLIEAAKDLRKWSDGEFSAQLGISQSTWSRIKGGKRPLDNVRFLRAVGRAMPELKLAITNYLFE